MTRTMVEEEIIKCQKTKHARASLFKHRAVLDFISAVIYGLEAHNMSQRELAKRCGTSPSHLNRILAYEVTPGLDLMFRISEELKLCLVVRVF
jgi:ribosome-binding protein aMBF1 (putative translation factor)